MLDFAFNYEDGINSLFCYWKNWTGSYNKASLGMQGHPQWGPQEQLSYTASTQPKVTTTSNNLYHIEIGPSQNQINTCIEPEKPSVILSNWAWSSCGFGFLSHTIKAVWMALTLSI